MKMFLKFCKEFGVHQKSLVFTLNLLWMSGLWPNTQRSRAYDFYILSVVSLFTSSVVMQIAELVYSHDDLRYVAEILFLLVACVINLFKISHILHRHSPISRLLNDLEREPPAELRQYCQEVIDKTDKRCKNFAILLLVICMGTGLSWSVSPLVVDRGKEDGRLVLVFAARFPFDLSKNNLYAMALIYEVIVVTGFSFVHAAVSLIQLVIIIHMCGRFEMLNTLLTSTDERAADEFNRKANVNTQERELLSSQESLEEQLSSNSNIKFTNDGGLSRPPKLPLVLESCSKEFEMNLEIETTSDGSIKSWMETNNSEQCCLNHTRYNCLVHCVQMHTRLVSYVRDMNNIFNHIMLINFIGLMSTICQASFLSIVYPDHKSKSIKFALYFVTAFSELFLYCWFGDELISQADHTKDVVYECQWYSGDEPFKRAVQMIMLRAQRPVTVTAGKMYKFTLSTFTTALKTCYSIFALLRQMQDD